MTALTFGEPTTSALAAEHASWERHVREALQFSARPCLKLIDGGRDDLTPPSAAHPASRALRKPQRPQ